MTAPSREYVLARRVLLDALDAIGPQRKSVVLVGAQAIYLRVGDGGLSVTPYTTDADLSIQPTLLDDSPELASCMRAAGFQPLSQSSVGIWVAQRDFGGAIIPVCVDLLVPDAVGGPGRRSARIPPHEERTARKVRGLEGVLFDHDPMTIQALDSHDLRRYELSVAGPAALVVSKVHKIRERLIESNRARGVAKDALDVVRLLRGCAENDIAGRLRRLVAGSTSEDEVRRATAAITTEAVDFLRAEFAVLLGQGCNLATEAAVGSMDEEELRASTVELTRRLLRNVATENHSD